MLAEQGDFKVFSKPVRILVIHTKYKEQGGECTVVQNELILLKENGCEIRELYFNNKQNTALNVLLMPFNFISFFKVIAVCLKYKPALVHMHNIHFAASPSVIWAIKLLRIPIVKTLHNYRLLCPSATLFFKKELFLKSLNKSFPWQAVKEKLYRNSLFLTFWLAFSTWFHRIVGTWRKVDTFIVFTEQSKQLFLNSNLGFKKEQVIIKPNFSGINLKSPTIRNSKFLFIGRLSQEKGIATLLDAFACNGLPLTIIGDGPYNAEVLKAMKENLLIEWKGYQDRDTIFAELKTCAALISPSICYEGMPLTIIEALASGTPVITSRLGAMERMIQHNYNGLLFEAGNSNDLNRQLYNWNGFKMAEKKVFYLNAVKTYDENYTPERNLLALLSIYHTAINKGKADQRSPVYNTNHKLNKLRTEGFLDAS